MVWGALIGIGANMAGGALEGSAANKQRKEDKREQERQRIEDQRLAHGASISQSAVPYLNQNIVDTFGGFADRGDFVGDAGGNQFLDEAMFRAQQRSTTPQGMMDVLFDDISEAERTGKFNITADAIGNYASQILEDPSTQARMDSYGRGINRTLNENVMPSIQASAIGSGGLGGSRAAMSQGLAMRDAGDSIAGYRQGLTEEAMGHAQTALGGNAQMGMDLINKQMAGAKSLQDISSNDFSNLIGAGQLQNQIDQSRQDNIMSARDWELQNILQYGSSLQQQGAMGNYLARPGETPMSTSHATSLTGGY